MTILAAPIELGQAMDRLLGWSTPLGFFPVRHHSPTCAYHLEKWLRAFRPDAVLIEGPDSFNDRIDVLSDPEHEAPFALVVIARAQPRKDGTIPARRGKTTGRTKDRVAPPSGDVMGRAYYPFCDYSPELVALRVAREIGAKARFIDRPFGEGMGLPNAGQPPVRPVDASLSESRFTRALMERSGCRDFDELWESLFEQGGFGLLPEEWARRVAVYAWLSRREVSQAELDAAGTLLRERRMAGHIAQARREHARIAVVTGAFHMVALGDAAQRVRAPSRARDAKGAGAEVFLAPYTFPRLDARLGYASGMTAPQLYQYVWDCRTEPDPFASAALRVLVEASRLVRGEGEGIGTADAVAAFSFAQKLAAMRGRSSVGRMEIIEAAQSCFVKGDASIVGQRVLGAIGFVLRGTKVGRLGPSAGRSPLLVDFHRITKALRLTIEHGRPVPYELPIYTRGLAADRSHFFHRCAFLGIRLCERKSGPDVVTGQDLHLSVERWTVQYVPEVEDSLADLSHLGASVEDVAAALFVEACAASEGQSGELASLLARLLAMGLRIPAVRLVPRLAAAILEDTGALSLLAAASRLRALLAVEERMAGARVEGLPDLARQALVHGTLRLSGLVSAPPERMEEVFAALGTLLDAALVDHPLGPSRRLITECAREARDVARANAPLVLGAIDGFLFQLDAIDGATLRRDLVAFRARSDGIGAYLEGILAIARQALLASPDSGGSLLAALLEYVRDSEWNDFLASLPSLRRAMTRLSPREIEALAERAARVLGVSAAEATEIFTAPIEVVARLGDWERAYLESESQWAGPPAAPAQKAPRGSLG